MGPQYDERNETLKLELAGKRRWAVLMMLYDLDPNAVLTGVACHAPTMTAFGRSSPETGGQFPPDCTRAGSR